MTGPVARAADSGVGVTVDARGRLLDLEIDRHELRYGGEALCRTVLALIARAQYDAAEQRRRELLARGVPPDVADRTAHP